jgi:hypothetical protein
MKSQLDKTQLLEIDKKVVDRIKKGEFNTGAFTITHTSLKLMLIIKALEYLQWHNIKLIKRPYPKPQHNTEPGGHWIWEAFPKEILRKKIIAIYENLADTYNEMVKNTFEQISKELDFFKNFNKLIIHVQLEKKTAHGEPHYTFYYLKSNDTVINAPYYELYFDDEFPYDKDKFDSRQPNLIRINEKEYTHNITSWGGFDFIYKETPVLDTCYELLDKSLKEYLDTL